MTTTGAETEPAGELPPRPVSELPDAVRQRVVGWAAEALGTAGPTDVPPALSRFARFAPGKRAKLAATALGQAVRDDAAFRAMVAEYAARQQHRRVGSATEDERPPVRTGTRTDPTATAEELHSAMSGPTPVDTALDGPPPGDSGSGDSELGAAAVGDSALNDSALNKSVLNKSALNNAVLGDAAVGGSALSDAVLNDAVLGDAAVGGSVLSDAAVGGSAPSGAALNDAVFGDVAVGGSALSDAALNDAVLGDAAVDGSVLSDAAVGGSALNDSALGDVAAGDSALNDAVLGDAAVGDPAPGTDPVTAAALAYLLRLPDEDRLMQAAAQVMRHTDARARVGQLEREIRVLTSKLARTAAELQVRQAVPDVRPGDGEESERLRRRLRDQGNRMRELQLRVDAGATRTAELVAAAEAERDAAVADAQTWRQRAETATARAEAAAQGLQRLRDAAGDRRAVSDRRIELLLGALEGAASGLRRELDLLGGGPAPADVIAAGLPQPPSDAERTADPSRLAAWAGLPGAHLIVDGYNVTKTGFPELSLSEQRDRLVRSVAALSARTGAEVTVVFDGAAVAAARPPARGVRVLFSPPGVLADDVIRDLVRAEPRGRVVIVVSTDRQVADRAAADGARTAASAVLLAAIGS